MIVFPLSLADDAQKWWINEREGKITVWEELVEKFFCKFYLESYDGVEEMLDEGDNWGIDPLEFISRINSSFDKHMKIDGITKTSRSSVMRTHSVAFGLDAVRCLGAQWGVECGGAEERRVIEGGAMWLGTRVMCRRAYEHYEWDRLVWLKISVLHNSSFNTSSHSKCLVHSTSVESYSAN
ncbi:hypothetical protein Tco_0360012 [Tanacetum coccineum]